MERMLRQRGYEVRRAATVAEAVGTVLDDVDVLVACGSGPGDVPDANDTPSPDAGNSGSIDASDAPDAASLVDAGDVTIDAGEDAVDAGEEAVDAGAEVVDAGPVTVDHFQRVASLAADLDDPDVMAHAWS